MPVKKTLLENDARWNISFHSTESGAGEEFPLLDFRARACAKGVFLSQTPVRKPMEKSENEMYSARKLPKRLIVLKMKHDNVIEPIHRRH